MERNIWMAVGSKSRDMYVILKGCHCSTKAIMIGHRETTNRGFH